ncbi:cyanophycinase [Oxobacter pfennigii]|uniref:Cyanophycinase n=1 Tax=Oxobacter pfennigii TaxID=36849 RepID=A0A0P8YXT1_9CLOT|nr:cyanophycinase [Oxobacter pfennigii]KPU44572.1 cyanophycinase [Oxobacter pfennigii]
MSENTKGKLVIIGGAEDKEGKCEILRKVVHLSGKENSRIVVMTTATERPEEVGSLYKKIFKRLGVKTVDIVNINARAEASNEEYTQLINEATCIFFTGGDQLRITSLLGGTDIYKSLHDAYQRGALIVGTSAGASAMSSNMIVEGSNDDAAKLCTLNMAPGLSLLNEVIIDQHFAQRGRIGRLMSAVAQNPHMLGVGIDEDTAITVEGDNFYVIGSQSVTVVDGMCLSHTNVSELMPEEPLALTNVKLHILPKGYGFDLISREPKIIQKESTKEEEIQ